MITTAEDRFNNLLLALHKYAHQQDENFTTEVLVHLLRHLQAFEPEIAPFFLSFLTGGRLKLTAEDCSKLKITTQSTFMEGRPDILIASPTHFVIIEVKVEAGPGWNQLDRYRELLGTREESEKYLVLLSRYPVEPNEVGKVDSHVRWHRIARVLAQTLGLAQEATTVYLVRQLLAFLMERGMAMEKVGWELVRGVQSLMSLMDMLGEAVRATKVKEKSGRGGADLNGRYFTVDDTECWSGIYYSKPQAILFEAYNLNKTKAEAVPFGRVQKQSKEVFKWSNELNLEDEEVHFFALSSDNQQSRIQ